MRLRPGGFAWLVAADLRLALRRFDLIARAVNRPAGLVLLALAALAFHLIAWPAASWLKQIADDPASAALLQATLAAGALFVLPWLISQAITNTTRALYTRGDLDLLMGSPLPGSRVLGARAVSICFEAIAAVAIFLAPLANMAALLGGVRWLGIYGALLGSGLLATAIGVALTLGLFALIGPKRTRGVAQIMAMLIGAGFVLAMQIAHLAPGGATTGIVKALEAPVAGGLLDARGALWLPVRAAQGEPLALVAWLAVGAAAFAVVAILLGGRFTTAATVAAGTPASSPQKRREGPERAFGGGVGRALRRKEWKLLMRDPWLISQLAMQAVYTMPIGVILWRSQGADGSLALAAAPTLVVTASQFGAALTWLAVSSEDAPEFLATAPVSGAQIERRKIEAVALPLALVFGPLLALMALAAPAAAALTGAFAAGAALSTCLVNLWHPTPARRSTLMRRHAQSKLVGMIEHLLSVLWALAVVLALLGSFAAVAPLIVAAGVLGAIFHQRRARRGGQAARSSRRAAKMAPISSAETG